MTNPTNTPPEQSQLMFHLDSEDREMSEQEMLTVAYHRLLKIDILEEPGKTIRWFSGEPMLCDINEDGKVVRPENLEIKNIPVSQSINEGLIYFYMCQLNDQNMQKGQPRIII